MGQFSYLRLRAIARAANMSAMEMVDIAVGLATRLQLLVTPLPLILPGPKSVSMPPVGCGGLVLY